MQATINMAQALLEQGKGLWEQDRYEEATRVLSRLLGLRAIPAETAERAQFYLADMQLAQGHYAKARRHLSAAIASGGSGDTHFMMACALDWDEQADPRRAYAHYRQAVTLEPGQPLYSSAYALMRIRQKSGRTKFDREALRRLRAAVAAEPEDPDIAYNYAAGLLQMGRHGEAEFALRRARKRWPGHPAFEELWQDYLEKNGLLPPRVKFPRGGPRLRVVPDDEPVILRFPNVGQASSLPVPDWQAGSLLYKDAPGRQTRSLPRNARAPRSLGANSRLTAVLRACAADDLARLARRLGLPPTIDTAEQRRHIRRALLDRQRLQSIVARLSPDGRRLMRTLSESNKPGARSVQVRLDGPATHTPHFVRTTSRPLEELRSAGLVFLVPQSASGSAGQLTVIPSDLRKLLRDVIDWPA